MENTLERGCVAETSRSMPPQGAGVRTCCGWSRRRSRAPFQYYETASPDFKGTGSFKPGFGFGGTQLKRLDYFGLSPWESKQATAISVKAAAALL